MDNLTHSLVGLLIAKTGLERKTPYAVSAAIVAANGPDIDLIASLGGRWSYLAHHRGTSHSIIGVLAISLGIALVFWLADRLIAKWRNRPPRGNLAGLIPLCLVAGATHPILDWTNNYGVRPFLPFDGRWYYGDLVFVFDPWIWLILAGTAFWITGTTKAQTVFWGAIGLILTALLVIGAAFSLPNKRAPVEVGTVAIWMIGVALIVVLKKFARHRIASGSLAALALCLIPLYWVGLQLLRDRAFTRMVPTVTHAQQANESLRQFALMPTFGDPWRWQALAETDQAVYRATYSPFQSVEQQMKLERYGGADATQQSLVARARSDPRAQVFFGFARFPLGNVIGTCTDKMVVRFVDLRYTEPATGGEPFSVDVPVDCPVRR